MGKNKVCKKLMSRLILLLIVWLNLFASCKQQRVNRTINKALKNIETKDYVGMRNLIGTNVAQDTSVEGIIFKMVEASYFLNKYHSGRVKDLVPIYTDSVDDLGRYIIIVPLYRGYDSLTGLYDAKVVFCVGPFDLFPASKLTGFNMESSVDVTRRRFIRKNNLATYNFDSVSSVEYEKLRNK